MFINEDGDKKKVLLNAAGDSFLLLSILMFQPASRILIRLLLPCRNDSARIGGTFTRRRYFSSCIAHVTAITIAIRDSRSGTTAASPSPSFFSFLPSPFSLQSLSLSLFLSLAMFFPFTVNSDGARSTRKSTPRGEASAKNAGFGRQREKRSPIKSL